MNGTSYDEGDPQDGHRRPQQADPEDFYPPRPRLSPVASLALALLLGLALWGLIFLFVG